MAVPSVSCLCVTRNEAKQVRRAIECFLAQCYLNRELLILYESGDAYKYVGLKEEYGGDVVFMEVPSSPKLPLGDLRNMAIEECHGDYFCQWDGDDWYASNRLTAQMGAIQSHHKPSSMLTHWLIFDAETGAAYLSPFKFWEGSILCRKSVIAPDCKYASTPRGEDTFLLEKMIEGSLITPIMFPALYIYIYHGGNTWDRNHFSRFFRTGKRLSPKASALVKDVVEERHTVVEGTRLLHSSEFMSELEVRVQMTSPYDFKFL